jgi:hypothetical protein
MNSILHAYRFKSRGYQKDPPALIHPAIMVGAGEMLTPAFQQHYGITHVINCAEDDKCPTWFKHKYPTNYHFIGAIDSLNQNILTWYPEFREVMRDFLTDKSCRRVFVHCQCGINRSAFLALLYVCHVFDYPVERTMLNMLNQRPCMFTNSSFYTQIERFLKK